MRVDDGIAYNLPGLFYHASDEDGITSSMRMNNPDQAKYWKKGITLNLEGLPMIHDDGVQTGVGARAWYNSAVLSAMMLSVLSSSDDTNTTSASMRHLLRQDMIQLMKQQEQSKTKNPTVLEIGAGAIGLVGMTMAWILSHKQQELVVDTTPTTTSEEEKLPEMMNLSNEIADGDDNDHFHHESKVILTDNDEECLGQLQLNVNSVLMSLLEFNSVMQTSSNNRRSDNESKEEQEQGQQVLPPSSTSSSSWSILSDDAIPFLSLPSIQTKILDWNDHDVPQDVLEDHQIDFVVGAELAYHKNNCCALQVAKILELNPKAVIWIVQLPRNGWFKVFEMQLRQVLPRVEIHKMDPIKVDPEIHQLAVSIMPMPVGLGSHNVGKKKDEDLAPHERFTSHLEDIKALRISLKKEEARDDTQNNDNKETAAAPTAARSFDLGAQIEQAKRLSLQLNSTQESCLDSHWELG